MTVLTGRRADWDDILASSRRFDEGGSCITSFPIVDTYEGEINDPQSLHKYLYCHVDPVNSTDPTGMFTLAGLGMNMGIGAALGGLVSGSITTIGGGDWSDIGASALRGAMTGAVAGGLGYSAGSLIGVAASGMGSSLLLTGILEIVGGSVVAGAGVGMLDAWLDGRDIYQGAAEGALFGLIMSPIYGIGAGSTFRFAGQAGPGQQTGIGRKLLRTIWEDRSSFSVSREFFKRWRSVFGNKHKWSMEHVILKQRWYRNGSGRMNKILQGLGDSGINSFLVPKGFNIWMHNHQAAEVLIKSGFASTTFAGEYMLFHMAYQLGETIADTIFGSELE